MQYAFDKEEKNENEFDFKNLASSTENI